MPLIREGWGALFSSKSFRVIALMVIYSKVSIIGNNPAIVLSIEISCLTKCSFSACVELLSLSKCPNTKIVKHRTKTDQLQPPRATRLVDSYSGAVPQKLHYKYLKSIVRATGEISREPTQSLASSDGPTKDPVDVVRAQRAIL